MASEAKKIGNVTSKHRILRAAFLAMESGTIAGTIIFLSFDQLTKHGSNVGELLGWFVLTMYLGLLVVSFPIRRYDRNLSDIGFLTCFAAFVLGAIFPRL